MNKLEIFWIPVHYSSYELHWILDCKTLIVGPVEEGQGPKELTFNEEYKCPTRITKTNWLNRDTYDDTFSLTQNGVNVVVERTDNGLRTQGWGMNLKIECCIKISGKYQRYSWGRNMLRILHFWFVIKYTKFHYWSIFLLDTCAADSHCVHLKNHTRTVCDVDEGRCVGKNGAERKLIVSIYHFSLKLDTALLYLTYLHNFCLPECLEDSQCHGDSPACNIEVHQCVGKSKNRKIELVSNFYSKNREYFISFYVICGYSFHFSECLDNLHCHDNLTICDKDAHQCVGKNIIIG